VGDIRVHIDTLEYTRDGLRTKEPLNLQVGTHNRVVLVRPERARPSSAGMGGFAVDSCFPTPSALAVFLSISLGDALVDLFNAIFGGEKQPDNRVFQLYGHADITGDEAGNKTLSEKRAEAMRALLVRDVDAFIALGEDEQWDLSEQQVMLRTLQCDPGPIDGEQGDLTEAATRDFQADYVAGVFHSPSGVPLLQPNLAVDGDLGPDTYKALLEALVLGCSPGIPPEQLHPTHPTAGCTEYNRISEESNSANRRVTLVVHEQLPVHHDAAPCTVGDHSACPYDDRHLSGCLWYREHIRDPLPAEFTHHHYDLRWLPLKNGGVLLSALTTLEDGDEVTFQVFRTGDVSGPEDVHEDNLGRALTERMQGIVRSGVAQLVWLPEEDEHFDLFEPDDWYVPVEFATVARSPQASWNAGPTLRPPVFRVDGGGATALSHPPGQDPHRIRLESEDGQALDTPMHAIAVDVYGRVLDIPLAAGRSTITTHMREISTPVMQFEVRGASSIQEEQDQ